MSKHIVFGIAVGLAVFVLLTQFIPAVGCADGWLSPSIGRQGACSHHGGIQDNGAWILLAAGASIWAGMFVAARFAPSGADLAAAQASAALKGTGDAAYRPIAELIVAAIRAGNKVSFVYTKRGSTISEPRTIVPRGFRRVSRPSTGGSTFCVVGFCETRRAERTFAAELMNHVRVIGHSSPSTH